ncbi:MAG: TetR/AcrR family transcriptional regulator [Blastomonas sp.]|jgi:AcrR family transcriptional regulator
MTTTATPRKRTRDPAATREGILEASSVLLAQKGADAIAVSAVAQLAGVNRGTAYQHFADREMLVQSTLEWVSERMFRAVFGDPERAGARSLDNVDVSAMMTRLVEFAMDNADLGRIWLQQILASPEPTSDPFWREFENSVKRFAETDLAAEGLDTEALAVLMLSGVFMWPVWARAHAKTEEERRHLARRFSREVMRLSMFGSMASDKFPEIAARLRASQENEAR